MTQASRRTRCSCSEVRDRDDARHRLERLLEQHRRELGRWVGQRDQSRGGRPGNRLQRRANGIRNSTRSRIPVGAILPAAVTSNIILNFGSGTSTYTATNDLSNSELKPISASTRRNQHHHRRLAPVRRQQRQHRSVLTRISSRIPARSASTATSSPAHGRARAWLVSSPSMARGPARSARQHHQQAMAPGRPRPGPSRRLATSRILPGVTTVNAGSYY